MSTSRADSQHSNYGRGRSLTAQSVVRVRPPTPLKVGDSKVLSAWVHDVKDAPTVLLNHSVWPGVMEGDLLRVVSSNEDNRENAFLFTVPKEDENVRSMLQISIPKHIADVFKLRNVGEVVVTKVDISDWSADYVEFLFQDQYLGRNDMWRLGKHLNGHCIYTKQEVSFIGSPFAEIDSIYIKGKKVSSACMTSSTKAIYRSLSAKVTIFIQVCAELWEISGDGERYNEKIVHTYLPELFEKWHEAGANHVVTIVLISRVYYEEHEIEYAAGPFRRDDWGSAYKDFYKVITELEVIHEWKPTLVRLKNAFRDFQRDILLSHHFHRAQQSTEAGPSQVRLVGRLSYAHDGPILEALNLILNPNEMHYIDRSLTLTGILTILISPGTGHFRVSRKLLRLTTTRMLDQGFVLDLILLTKPPLHQSPIFSYLGPEIWKTDSDGKSSHLVSDPLCDDADTDSGKQDILQWWEPFWVTTTFWDKQILLPFRHDRFVARARMHEIQLLGLLEHDVLASIEVPYLPERTSSPSPISSNDMSATTTTSQEEAQSFDIAVFALNVRRSLRSAAAASTSPEPPRNLTRNKNDKNGSLRTSAIAAQIATMKVPPRKIINELPPEGLPGSPLAANLPGGISKSPSQASVRSKISEKSTPSIKSSNTALQATLVSKLPPTWLFNPFRSAPSEPQMTQISASATPQTSIIGSSKSALRPSSPISMISQQPAVIRRTPSIMLPMPIRPSFANRSGVSRTLEEVPLTPQRRSLPRQSPMNTPPRDDMMSTKRRRALGVKSCSPSSAPGTFTNPSQPHPSAPYLHSALARRWQHMIPEPLLKQTAKWKSLLTPGCLPLTMEYFPSTCEIEDLYHVFEYDLVVDPREMQSFLVLPPTTRGGSEELRRAWALVVMRGMAAIRLAQGFQFVLRSTHDRPGSTRFSNGRASSLMGEDVQPPSACGASDVLRSIAEPVYLSITNEIHRISYTGDSIQVKRYVKKMKKPMPSFDYQCLICPKLGGGYTEHSMSFSALGLENYGWNKLDMLVAGYEGSFHDSLRYWRTRYVVLPTPEPPIICGGPSCEKLEEEAARLLGIEKLAEALTKIRWYPPNERNGRPPSPIRFLPTSHIPASSVQDETLIGQLDQIHAMGPLKKKMKSEREVGEMSLLAIAKAIREEDGVPLKPYQWHRQYVNAFTGHDFVSWLVSEFRDVSSRVQAIELAAKLQDQGLLEHCGRRHSFLDGPHLYHLKGDYALPFLTKNWLGFRRHTPVDEANRALQSPASTKSSASRKARRSVILTSSTILDVDPNKRSDQAESVFLHYDVMHNPTTGLHFEIQWLGTSARCIDDTLRMCSRVIERYGLKIVEVYGHEVCDIRNHNPFQACFPLPLALLPPQVPDLENRIPDDAHVEFFFEYALLKKFGFIIDVEASNLFGVDLVFSYERSDFAHSQFVHRTGVAFAEVIGGNGDVENYADDNDNGESDTHQLIQHASNPARGFLFLINRLMGPGRVASGLQHKENTLIGIAEALREDLRKFTSDKEALARFYQEQIAMLPPLEEPPPLTI